MESGYRLGCVGLLALSGLVSAWYYRKAGPLGELVHGESESAATAAVRLGWVVLADALPILWALHPAWLAWSRFPLADGVRTVAGVGLGAAHLAVLIWTHRALGANFSSSLRIRRDHELVTSGPYRWVRHPLYTGCLLLYGALGLLSASWLIAAVGLSFTGFIVLWRTPCEERMLVAAFGDEYRAYCRRTGRLLPRLFARPRS